MIQVLRSSWCFFCSNKLVLSKRIRTTGKQGRIVELEENSIPKMTSGLFYFLLLLLFSLSLVSYCLNCVCFYFQSFYQSQMLSTPHWSNPPDQNTQIQLLVLNAEDIYCKTDLYTFSLFFSLNMLSAVTCFFCRMNKLWSHFFYLFDGKCELLWLTRPLFRGDSNKQAQIKPQLQSLSSIGPKVLDMAL